MNLQRQRPESLKGYQERGREILGDSLWGLKSETGVIPKSVTF